VAEDEPDGAVSTSSASNPPDVMSIIAIASGHGSPGRTLIALNLAVALGAVAPTVLVDADVAGPSVAAYHDLDPTRSLFMIAHADPQTPREWDRAIAEETQPLGPQSPRGVALCGVPKPEMRAGISAAFFERLLGELRQRYRFVVLDVGADLLGQETILHRLALGVSDQVLFVAAADLIGLWHARVGLGVLGRALGLDGGRIALVINRHDRRYHHQRDEIAWALGQPVAALLPDDPSRVQKALLRQQPVVLDRRSRVGRQLLDLAERVHGGTIILPPEPGRARRFDVLRRIALPRVRWPFRARPPQKTGGLDERDLARTP
jgi:MinD-like ATPase involved in chromosome partitioning or flagellar assembly